MEKKIRHHPTRECDKCKKVYSYKDFKLKPINLICKPCRNLFLNKERYRKNPEKYRELSRINHIKFKEYYKKYNKEYHLRDYVKATKKRYRQSTAGKCADWKSKVKRRYLESKGNVTKTEWETILKQHKNKCAKCNRSCKLEMDHMIPLSRGGKHSKENIQPLCRHCNATKYNNI